MTRKEREIKMVSNLLVNKRLNIGRNTYFLINNFPTIAALLLCFSILPNFIVFLIFNENSMFVWVSFCSLLFPAFSCNCSNFYGNYSLSMFLNSHQFFQIFLTISFISSFYFLLIYLFLCLPWIISLSSTKQNR